MNKEQLYESINELSDTVLEKSEKAGSMKWSKKHWIALAACFCVVIFAVSVFTDRPQDVYDGFFYNDGQEVLILTDEPYGRYSEELDARELAAVLPEEMPDWMDCAAYARFSKEKELVYVELELSTTIPELDVRVTVGNDVIEKEVYNGLEYVGKGRPTISQCKDVEYILYKGRFRAGGEDRFMLTATTRINGNDMLFEVYGNWKLEEQAKADFEAILTSFATYPDGEPDLSVIISDSDPVWYRKDLTMEQAKADPDFGAYLPESLAEGTEVKELYREKNRYMDSLQSMWGTDGGFINWNISHYDPENENTLRRMVSVEDKEKYDRSLYPLPWTSEISEELQQTLESPIFLVEELTLEAVQARGFYEGSDRYVLEFSIVYEKVRILIYAVNVEPEWIFEQIQNLLKQ